MKARDIMSTMVVSVSPETAVREIAALMLEKHISGVPVLTEDGTLAGMISEGDLLRRPELGTEKHHHRWLSVFLGSSEAQARDFTKSHALQAGDVMTEPVVFIADDASLGEIVATMEENNVKRLPVVTDDKLVGIVSRTDLLRVLATRQAEPMPPPPETDAAIRATMNDVLKNEEWAMSAMVNVIVSDGVVLCNLSEGLVAVSVKDGKKLWSARGGWTNGGAWTC